MQVHKAPTRAALHLVFAILTLDVIGITMLYPIAPYIVLRWSDNALMVTLLSVIYAAAQVVAAPVLGTLGDRYGRRPVLLVSLCGSAVGYVLFGLAGALWIVFLARLIDGITAGNQSVAAAYLADVSTPATRAANFARIGMAWGIGLVIGPAIGASLGQWRLDAPAFLAAGLSLLAALLGYVWLPESLPPAQRARTALRWHDLNPFASIIGFARRPSLSRFLLVLCLFNFVFQGINSIETLFLIEKFALQPYEIGGLLVSTGIAVALAQPIVPLLVARYGEAWVACGSLLVLALGAMVMWVTPLMWLVVVIGMVRTMTSGFVFPTLGSLLVQRVPPHEQGTLMGVNAALTSLMSVLGPLWAGVVYEGFVPSAPYWMGAAVFVLAALVLAQPRMRLVPAVRR